MKERTISSITLICLLFSFMWIIGLGWSFGNYYAGKPSELGAVEKIETEKAETKDLTIVALGDSLTRGTGDESGKGYVGYVNEEVKNRTKKDVSLMNLGINGQRSEQLAAQVKQKEVQRQLSGADFIFITIGGNDLFRGGQGLMDLNPASVKAIEKKYLENIHGILGNVRNASPNATVFVIGLYNPFIELGNGKEISKIIREWNFKSAEVSAQFPKVVFVPTFDLFELKVNDYLYSDKFHPNAKGYRLMAERVASLMTW